MKRKFIISLVILITFSSWLFAQKSEADLNENGPKTEYYPNGKIMREYNLSNGKVNGSYKFFNEKGQLVSDQNYVDGIPQGYLRVYFESGQLQSETNFEDGIPTGPAKEFYENGSLKTESNYSGDPWALTGQSKNYYEDGKLRTETTISDGKLLKSITYDKQGRVIFEDSDGHSISYWYENETGKKHVSIDGVPQD